MRRQLLDMTLCDFIDLLFGKDSLIKALEFTMIWSQNYAWAVLQLVQTISNMIKTILRKEISKIIFQKLTASMTTPSFSSCFARFNRFLINGTKREESLPKPGPIIGNILYQRHSFKQLQACFIWTGQFKDQILNFRVMCYWYRILPITKLSILLITASIRSISWSGWTINSGLKKLVDLEI